MTTWWWCTNSSKTAVTSTIMIRQLSFGAPWEMKNGPGGSRGTHHCISQVTRVVLVSENIIYFCFVQTLLDEFRCCPIAVVLWGNWSGFHERERFHTSLCRGRVGLERDHPDVGPGRSQRESLPRAGSWWQNPSQVCRDVGVFWHSSGEIIREASMHGKNLLQDALMPYYTIN